MNTLEFLYRLFLLIIEVFLIFYLLGRRLGFPKKNRLKPVVGAVLIFFIMLLFDTLPLPNTVKICINFFLCIVYAYTAFGNGRIERILWGCIPMIVSMAANTLSLFIASLFEFGDLTQVWEFGSMHFYFTVISLMVQLIIVLGIANLGNHNAYNLSILQLIFLVMMALLSLMAIYIQIKILRVLTNIPATQNVQKNIIFVSICVLIIFLALIVLVFHLGKQSQRTLEKSLEVQQANMEKEYYKSNEISINALHELRHDISTHLYVMKTLLDQEKTGELKEYFDSIESKYEKENTMFMTDNTMLNALLTNKFMIAQKDHIQMRLSYITQNKIPLSPTDFCSLIGNLTDNAIEACRKVSDQQDRYIDIFIGDRGDMVYIKIKNSSNGNYKMIDGELRTTKNGARHGIGLKRIKEIAENVGGFLDINPRPNEFTAFVMLPSTDKEK